MIIENIFPVFMWSNPPASTDEAARRIAEQAGGSLLEAPMTRLVGSIFKSLDQFKRALCECKFIPKETFLMKSGPIQTVKIQIENMNNKTVWLLIATEYPQFLLIHNVKLLHSPCEKPEDVEAFKKALEEESL